MPTTALVTCKLVHALCASAKLNGAGTQGAKASGEWRKEFERFGERPAPERTSQGFLDPQRLSDHDRAVVARALEQATSRAAAAALQLKSDKKAVVGGLACVFGDRSRPALAWLGAFFTERFPNRENRAFAEKVISALRTYITPEDYGALKAFRDAVHAIAGESVPWTRVTMTDCCDYKPPGKLDPSANTGLSAYLDHIKH
ncbi:hypothetical protein Q5P01_000092 [Channa striata]|uniref:Uncharacterized protein n=1 Tax=Channa striata TaxID=64152 RepID=A0AA88IHG5_CHASR|nr:hypothetical protein Q5P01_000092 [Channa striata]